MAEVIDTAGLGPAAQPVDTRREAIKAVRAVIRNPQATDDDVEDALEALVELSHRE